MTRGNRRWVIGCAVLTCAAAVVLAPLAVRYSIARDTAMARQVSCASGEGTAIVARHPADFVIPLVIAERQLACANVPRSVFSLLNLAQYMAPQQSLPHRLTGRALLRLGKRDQAIAEYARAVSLQPLLVQSLLLELVARVGDIAIVTSVAARSPDNYLEVARFALWQRAPTVAHEVLAVGETTNDPEYFEVAAQTDLALEDWHAALASSNALERLNPSQSIAYTIQATALQRLSRIDDALAVLERGSRRGVDRGELSRAQFELLDRQGRYSEAREVALALLKVATSAAQISSAHAWLGNIHRREGNDLKALHEYERARDISPRIPIYRHLVASLRMELGDEQGAIAELRRARDELGPSPLFEPSSLAKP